MDESSKEFQLPESSELVPYEDGDHCLFYALQEAREAFQNKGLDIKYRSDLDQAKAQEIDRLKPLLEGNKDPRLAKGLGIGASLSILLSRLKEMGYTPTSFEIDDGIAKILKKPDFNFAQQGIQIEGRSQKLGWPCIIFVSSRYIDDTSKEHVWFCKDEDSFQKNVAFHIPEDSGIIGRLFF